METVTKSDFSELRRELKEDFAGVHVGLNTLGAALSSHALDDSEREGRVSG